MAEARPDTMIVFDRRQVRRQRDRAIRAGNGAAFAGADFLIREAAERLAERLADIRRSFPVALDLGCHDGVLRRALAALAPDKTGMLVEADLAPAMAAAARAAGGGPVLAADEEALPFAEASLDLVVSAFSLHWVNDLPGALLQIRRALKPDGLFLAVLPGGTTLAELRHALLAGEAATSGGAAPRVSPFIGLADAAGLLQRAGFALPVADTETVSVTYGEPLKLLADLRAMGEANALAERSRRPLDRTALFAAAEQYRATHAGADGRVPATIELIFLAGWAPAASQPQPLRPGSAAARLADALGTAEQPAGDKTPRGDA
jgi:NADH dehydrogenase [ubiquinone] 1 alpha subcomplex assembly factor 5